MELANQLHSHIPAASQRIWTFNGSPDPHMHPQGRIILDPRSRPITQKIKHTQHPNGTLWTIVLEYLPPNWEKFMTYAVSHELIFDLMLNNPHTGIRKNKSLFKCWITQNCSWEYNIKAESLQAIGGKLGGIKVIKKKEKVVLVIKLLL